MNKYSCYYNILINSSPFFVAALIKKSFTFIFHCNITFWASDFVAAFYFPFFISRHSLEHSICACFPLTPACVCLYVVKNLSNKYVIAIFSVATFVSLFLVFLSFKAEFSAKKHSLKQQNYKSVNLWSQHSWRFYLINFGKQNIMKQ